MGLGSTLYTHRSGALLFDQPNKHLAALLWVTETPSALAMQFTLKFHYYGLAESHRCT